MTGIAYATSITSNIGDITNSCLGKFSCVDMAYANITAFPSLVESSVDSLLDSCQNEGSCAFMAGGGRVGHVASSCNGVDACLEGECKAFISLGLGEISQLSVSRRSLRRNGEHHFILQRLQCL